MIKRTFKHLALFLIYSIIGILFSGFLIIKLVPENNKSVSFDTVKVFTTVDKNLILLQSENGYGSGSQIIVGSKKYIITNKHVCETSKNGVMLAKRNIPFKAEYIADFKTGIAIKIIATSPIYDICILEPIPGLPGLNLADSYNSGQVVFTDGFPSGYQTKNYGAAVGNFYAKGFTKSFVLLDFIILPGASCSPVVNSDGKVIGLIVARTVDGYNRALMVPLNNLKDFLSDKG